jgi:signal transduction histidine kinase
LNDATQPRLLIVDDESAHRVALCRALDLEGYATTGRESATSALADLQPRTFEVIITDLMMPELDGISFLRAVRSIDPEVVGIVMTGHGSIDTAVDAMKAGATDYILKPFNLSRILPILSRAVDLCRLRRQNAALIETVAERSTSLELANRELHRANHDLDAFAHSVSHDLRTPTNAIIGFTEFLLDGKPGPLNPKQKEYLGDIHASGHRQLRLIEGLLHFATLGSQPLAKHRVAIPDLIREIVAELRETQPLRNVELRLGAMPDAYADPLLIRQVFANLLSNAFKFTRDTDAACIEVDGHLDDGRCVYVVRDNGAGFDMQHAKRLFTIFCRLHGEKQFEGTGIGLSLVHRIVERHGGSIAAAAEIGRGASFTVTLPFS